VRGTTPLSTNQSTTDDANSRSSLLLYLDHSDLVDIADGRARDVDALRHALDVSEASLLISSIHLIDLGESTPSTKQRWIDATAHLAPLRFATQPGVDVPLDHDGLAKLVDDSASDVGTVRSVLALKQDAEDASRTARLGDAKPGLSKKRLRELAEAIIDGNLDHFAQLDNAIVQQVLAAVAPLRSMLETQNLDKAAVLSALFPDVEDAVAAGHLPEVVRLRRQQDQTRKPRSSDTPDEWHLQFAVHADVFTVDGNVAHVMRSVSGRPLPVRGRRAGVDGERVHVYRSGQLASVARALLALSDEVP
jgi:hypothetical protein